MKKIILDANVILSGIVFQHSHIYSLLLYLITEHLVFFSPAILNEVQEKLLVKFSASKEVKDLFRKDTQIVSPTECMKIFGLNER